MLQLQTLMIQQVMIQRIPKVKVKDKAASPLELTEAPISLTPDLQSFFAKRVTRSLDKARFVAEYDKPEKGAPKPATPKLVVDYFQGGGRLRWQHHEGHLAGVRKPCTAHDAVRRWFAGKWTA